MAGPDPQKMPHATYMKFKPYFMIRPRRGLMAFGLEVPDLAHRISGTSGPGYQLSLRFLAEMPKITGIVGTPGRLESRRLVIPGNFGRPAQNFQEF